MKRLGFVTIALVLILAGGSAPGWAQYQEESPAHIDTFEIPGGDIPGSLVVDADGHVYVAGYAKVWKFSSDGSVLWSKNLAYYYGISLLSGNQILLTGWNPPIRLIDASGAGVWSHGTWDSGTPTWPGEFSLAFHSDFDLDGNFYVTDYGWYNTVRHGFQKCSLSGCSQVWGSYGSGDDQFKYPAGVAFDAVSNSVFIMDSANHRLKKYALPVGGTPPEIWNGIGSDNIEGCKGPEGVDADVFGNIYVADTCNHRILKFAGDGTLLTAWGSFGADDGQFYETSDVHVTPDETIYVVDRYNYRIQVFRVPDDDGDGADNNKDNCRDDFNPNQSDVDMDGLGDVCDNCPFENPMDLDANNDGCIDRISDFAALVYSLGLPRGTERALLASINAAEKMITRGKYKTAGNQLRALTHKVEDQRGETISDSDANLLIDFALNIVAGFP